MKGRNNARKTRKTKETLTRLTGGLRPLTHDAEHEHKKLLAECHDKLEERGVEAVFDFARRMATDESSHWDPDYDQFWKDWHNEG